MRVGRDASRETKGRGATAAQAVCTGEVPRLKIGSRARAECTRNMELMVVTPDVSKLSGWLKADSCRAEKGGGDKPDIYARKCICPEGAATAQAVLGAWEGLNYRNWAAAGAAAAQAVCRGRPD